MGNYNFDEILRSIIDRALAIKGNYAVFCNRFGIDYSWLSKLVNGRITNPTIKSLAELDDAINQWNKWLLSCPKK